MITRLMPFFFAWPLFVTETNAWNINFPKPRNNNNKVARDFAAAVWIGGTVLLTPHIEHAVLLPPAFAASSSSGVTEEQLRQSLKPATSSQPQIMLPTTIRSNVPLEKQPIVEGLISLANPTSELRPLATDTIVITFRSVSQPDRILGGARIPVSKAARFPLAFRMFPKNLLEDQKEAWNNLIAEGASSQGGDLLVKVLVCPEDNPKCTEFESRMQSQGVAKLIRNLPGQQQDQSIRAPAALRLQ